MFAHPSGLAVDPERGWLYVGDIAGSDSPVGCPNGRFGTGTRCAAFRRVTPGSGAVVTAWLFVAGYMGALRALPSAMAVSGNGETLYAAFGEAHCLYAFNVSNGLPPLSQSSWQQALAGYTNWPNTLCSNNEGHADGAPASARFTSPWAGLERDGYGNIYVVRARAGLPCVVAAGQVSAPV